MVALLLRQPAPHEVRELRATILALDPAAPPSGRRAELRPELREAIARDPELRAAREYLVGCAAFYTGGGVRELLLHPSETSYTLPELGALLDSAGLELLGVWFPSLETDRRAREAYNASAADDGGFGPADGPDRQLDLGRWHRLEELEPGLFGRTHVVYAQKRAA